MSAKKPPKPMTLRQKSNKVLDAFSARKQKAMSGIKAPKGKKK